MDRHVLTFITSAEGARQVSEVAAELDAGADELSVISGLRAAYDASVAAEIVRQARLHGKAAAKLGGRAQGLVLLAESLEQASRAEVADARARRLVAHGVTAVTDAGAGLGADSIAYAEAGLAVRAIERDPLVAAVLRHNVSQLGAPQVDAGHVDATEPSAAQVEVVEGDALELLPSEGVVYFDPARRADGRRIFDPELCTPPLSALVSAQRRGLTIVAKMSPSLKPADVPQGWDADWVSTQTEQGRSVVETVLWSPPLGNGVRRALVLDRDGSEHRLDSTDDVPLSHGPVGRYIYEPDGAVNQAELGGVLAQHLRAHGIEPRIAYLTGDAAIDTPFAHRYEVLEQLPWSKRGLARALARYDAADLVIKKRGITLDPTALRKELLPKLRSRTGEPLVVILTPHAGGRLALLTRAT